MTANTENSSGQRNSGPSKSGLSKSGHSKSGQTHSGEDDSRTADSPSQEMRDQPRDERNSREQSSQFLPKFDSNGLLSAVVIDAASKEVLMVAFMNEEALNKTIESGFAHFHSRSRGRLWKKGETSGNVLKLQEIRVDCDQDCLLLFCQPSGPTCHTGANNCFYRTLGEGNILSPLD